MNPPDFISARARAVDASGIRKVFDLAAKMTNPINLSIGLPDFDVPDPVKTAAIEAIRSGKNRYTPTQGIEPLRQRLRDILSEEIGRDVGDVLITSGVSGGLFLCILATIDPGDEAIFLDPYFVMYKHLMTLAGGRSVIVDSYPDFRFHVERVEQAVTERTKLLILNSPSNPTGVTLTADEIRAAVGIARRHNLLILSDEIYEPFLYDEESLPGGTGFQPPQDATSLEKLSNESQSQATRTRLPSPASLYENTILLRGFSKSHATTGWRLGYAAGPAEVLSQMAKLQQYTYVCAPAPMQYAALAALDLPMDDAVAAYRRKRDLVHKLLSAHFEVVRPDGAFYIFPKAPDGVSATDFITAAIERNVLAIPGAVFSERDTHFRISYAATEQHLTEGCQILADLAKKVSG